MEHNKMRKKYVYACHTCGKNEAMLDGAKLLACGKCRKIDRKVWYCSRCVMLCRLVHLRTNCHSECQLQDWKSGKPRPHRVLCGKPLDEEAAQPVETTEESAGASALDDKGIPPPDPGDQRSPALLHQISLLSEHPEYDYVVRPHILFLIGFLIASTWVVCATLPEARPGCHIRRSSRYVT